MSDLVLRRASVSRSPGRWKHEDYDVRANGKIVGRIYESTSASTPPELRWFWSITATVRGPGAEMNGHAPTLELAKAKFRENWRRAETGG